MVGKEAKAEFERDGVRAVREHLEQGSYWEGKKQQVPKHSCISACVSIDIILPAGRPLPTELVERGDSVTELEPGDANTAFIAALLSAYGT